ncbi:nucleotide-binding protein [Actinomadura parmotrematis]|uniref:AAA family ATPase n=1 Tax=Actinomadura parmotrematis TaxID=2864039 RepID=A0ABS7G094_9ACTN|nr:AAA family ATPase [Actinomadura parmotrematis]MBW8485289.1 AAA family ATPase [Actinomadura parmotrematis]
MSDSSWQQAVLRDLGAAQRGFVSDAPPASVLSREQWSDGAPWPAEQATAGSADPSVTTGAPPPAEWGAAPPAQPVQPDVPVAPVPDGQSRVSGGWPVQQPETPAPDAWQPAPAADQGAGWAPDPQQTGQQPPSPDPAVAWNVEQPPPEQPQQTQQPQRQEQPPEQQWQQEPQIQPAPESAPLAAPVTPPAQHPQQPEQPQADPLVHPDFDWGQAVSPVLGMSAPAEEQQPPQQPDAASLGQAQQPTGRHAAVNQPPAHDLLRKSQHGDGLVRRVGRGMRGVVGTGLRNAQEQAAFADLMQRQVPSFRQIAIASVRGGAGKTSVSALISTELARHRGDRVLAVDADAELGSLPLRLGVQSELSLFDLAGENPRSFEEAARFLTRTPEGLWVLTSTRGGRIVGEFRLPTLQAALAAVSRFVSAVVVDCGAGILTEVNQGVIGTSHALVLVTPGTVDGALSARGALEWFAGNQQQDLLGRIVVAMVSHAPQAGADLGRASEMISAWGVPVVLVPYDRQLATGAAVDMGKVGANTRAAVTRIVFEAFGRSLGAPR